MPLYRFSSTLLGSTRINLSISGECLYNIERRSVLIETDLPVPVAPATNKWGILSKPANTGLPATSRPMDKGKKNLGFLYSSLSSISRKPTIETFLFGTSIPTRDFPGIGASILMGWAARARDKSELRVVILESFTPTAGLIVNWVTVGPTETSPISTSMPKLPKVLLIILALA